VQSAAYFGFEGSKVHYRYVCTLWSRWTYIVFYNYGLWCPYSRFITDNKCPPLDHIVSRHNSSHIFIIFSLVLHCIACCSQIHPIITITITIHIFNDMPVIVVFPSFTRVYFFIGLPAFLFPCRIKFRILVLWCTVIIFSIFALLFGSWNCVCMFLSSSSVIGLFSFLFWSQYCNFYCCLGWCFSFLSVIFCYYLHQWSIWIKKLVLLSFRILKIIILKVLDALI